jgi:hypothetical protein
MDESPEKLARVQATQAKRKPDSVGSPPTSGADLSPPAVPAMSTCAANVTVVPERITGRPQMPFGTTVAFWATTIIRSLAGTDAHRGPIHEFVVKSTQSPVANTPALLICRAYTSWSVAE